MQAMHHLFDARLQDGAVAVMALSNEMKSNHVLYIAMPDGLLTANTANRWRNHA
jgi:hypothetical protein